MAAAVPNQPIDDEELSARIVAAALAAERQLLSTATLPSQPGAYLLFVAPSRAGVASELGPLTRGTRPVYAGAAADLRGRVQRYRSRQSLHGAEAFPFARLWIGAVPTQTLGGALLCEAVLHAACRPVFNHPELAGLGSRMQGTSRISNQRPSPFDRVYQRPWARRALPEDACATLLALVSAVVAPDPTGPRWLPLPCL